MVREHMIETKLSKLVIYNDNIDSIRDIYINWIFLKIRLTLPPFYFLFRQFPKA